VVIVAACGVMAYMNNVAYNSAEHTFDDQVKKAKVVADRMSKISFANGIEPSGLVTEANYGDADKSNVRVTVGFTVSDYLASHPSIETKIATELKAACSLHQGLSARVVCLDIPPSLRTDTATENVPLGLAVNGKSRPGLNSDTGPGGLTDAEVGAVLAKLYPAKAPQ